MTLDTANVATLIVAALVLVGCIIAIVHPETLTYQQLLDDAGPMIGLLAVGRGLAASKRT